MYEGLRLIELHEEWAWVKRIAAHCVRDDARERWDREADLFDAEIRRRVSAQEIGPPFLLSFYLKAPLVSGTEQFQLISGTPDAERRYPDRYDHWSCHARHAVPVPTWHLCNPEPTRWTPAGFINEPHIPGETQ